MFKVIRQSKITQKIISQIRTAILSGALKPGDKLPSEKELMVAFQVSKQTLRESLRALEHQGLLMIRKGTGGGAYVVEVDVEVTKQCLANFLYFKDLTIQDLSTIRKLLEPHAAKKAAEDISQEGLERLKQLNDQAVTELKKNFAHYSTQNEIKFHLIIAENTNNPILLLVLDFVESLLEDFKDLLKPDEKFSKSVIDSHIRIYDAIAGKDSKRAEKEMLDHVQEVEDYMLQLKDNIDLQKFS